eukprot:5959783-Prymnesium_polylepis.2
MVRDPARPGSANMSSTRAHEHVESAVAPGRVDRAKSFPRAQRRETCFTLTFHVFRAASEVDRISKKWL